MTRWYRDPFATSAAALAGVAFAGSFDHTRATIIEHGQSGWVATATALMPEAMVLLSVLRIRMHGATDRQRQWAWVVLVSSAMFTLGANLAQAEASTWGLIVAGWPAWAAIGAAGFIEMGHKEESSTNRASGEQRSRTRASRVTTTRPGSASGTSTASTNLALVGAGDAVPSSGTARVSVEQAMIVAQAMRDGDVWPSQRALASEAGCARGTATKALERLMAEVAA